MPRRRRTTTRSSRGQRRQRHRPLRDHDVEHLAGDAAHQVDERGTEDDVDDQAGDEDVAGHQWVDTLDERRKAGLEATDHPSLGTIDLDAQQERVATAWDRLAELEQTCRNERPTLLVRSAQPEPPDLSKLHN